MRFFSILGAQRSGSTKLYDLLDRHPQIEMAKPVRPEPKYFLKPLEELDRDAYLKQFYSLESNPKLIGEKSTSYVEYPNSVVAMKRLFPDCKGVVILRNPVDRALSNYFFSVDNGIESRSLEQVFIEQTAISYDPKKYSVSPFAYLERGLYLNYLEGIIPLLNKNLRIVILEDFLDNTFDVMSDLYTFLGVDVIHQNDVNNAVNSSSNNPLLVDEHIRAFLIDYYAESVHQLEEKLGIELKSWKR